MSVRVLSRVLHGSDTKLAARLVLISLADAAHDDGIAWLGQAEIAGTANISQAHTREMLRELEEAGAIETRKAQRGRRRINVYRVMCAPLDPDYDRLPFVLAKPFSTTAEIPRSSIGDDRGFTESTTADLPTFSGGGSLEARASTALNRKGTRNLGDYVSSGEGAPPELVKVDGRNLGFDAIAAVCGYDPKRKQDADETAVALNGSRKTGPGIRAELWAEDVAAGWASAELAAANPEGWERRVAAVVEQRAALYRRKMPGATMTPTALAKWWGRLPAMPDADRRVTADRILEGPL